MHAICRRKILLFWCFYGVTYNFILNHNHWRDLHQIFSCLFETFGTMSEIMFSSDSMSKKNFQQLKIHEFLLSFTTSLFSNGWETVVQKIVIHIQAILDFQINLYFKETQQTNAMITCHLRKKRVLHQKGRFPNEKQAFGRGVMI